MTTILNISDNTMEVKVVVVDKVVAYIDSLYICYIVPI